jgi:hypothetical protein
VIKGKSDFSTGKIKDERESPAVDKKGSIPMI